VTFRCGRACTTARPGTLTGGSSSGAAASVLEGSAVAAIGTDTGRLNPRACRAVRAGRLPRHTWARRLAAAARPRGFIRYHGLGWFRDSGRRSAVGSALRTGASEDTVRYRSFGVVDENFLNDCDAEIVAGFRAAVQESSLSDSTPKPVDVSWWS